MPTDQEVAYSGRIKDHQGKTDLVMVTYYRKELTQKCLEALFLRTGTPYRLTVVDNGSQDGTVEYLLDLKRKGKIDNLILLDRNYGLEYARNTALRHIHSPECVFFDNDLICPDLSPDWLAQELELKRRHPEYGCIALRPQILIGADNNKFNVPDEIVENNHVGATFMMFDTKILSELGWDDIFTNRVADWRLGDLLKDRGLKMGWCKDLFCYHIFGKNWSYPDDVEHFHREVWPPVECFDNIEVDHKTLRPINK